MELNWKQALVVGACLMMPGLASAHELTCDKRVDGRQVLRVNSYPTEVTWGVRINNVHPNSPSVVESFEDSLLSQWAYDPEPPFAIPVGGHVWDSTSYTIGSYAECLEISRYDGRRDRYIDNRATVGWDLGEAQCSARIICERPKDPPCEGPNCPCEGPNCPCEGPDCPCEGPDCPCEGDQCPTSDTTRTRGFYQTHISATQQCLDAGGPIVLGDLATITTIEDAMGIFWGSVPRFPDDTFRTQAERARFQLAVQTLAGICNVRLFGSSPTPANLIETALDLLELPYACNAAYRNTVNATQELMDDFNNSGDSEPFPGGFVPGPATPQAAMDLAEDPTSPDGNCL